MKDLLLAIAVIATIAISLAVDEECIQRKLRGLPIHWSNPTDCSRFFRCTNRNIKREFLCPQEKEYNSRTGRCGGKGESLCRLSLRAPLAVSVDNSCAGKISGSFVPDPHSCRGFSICHDNLTYPQTCDTGSYFNSATLACEPDTKTACWENLCFKKANGTYVPNKNDSHTFYICYEEIPVIQNCPDGSSFNVESLNCQPEVETHPTDTTTTTCAPETTTTPCTTKTTTTCVPETTTAPCTTKTTTTCVPETTTTACTTKTTTTCVPETTTTTCAAVTTTTACGAVVTTTSCSYQESTTSAPDISNPATKLCAGHYNEGDFVADPNNCMLFYICYEGELLETSCGTGNYYDANVKACLPDKAGKCPNCHYTEAYSSSRRNKRSIIGNCVEGSKTPAADCDKYYKCSKGQKLLYGCGKGHFFNFTTLACQLDVDHVCCSPNSCKEGDKLAYAPDDTKYYQCVDAKLVLMDCEANTYFNKLSLRCVAKQECTCPGGYKEGDISAHPTDCDKFYICTDGGQMLHECGKGNYFDHKTLSCKKDVENTCNVERPCLCPGGYEEGELSPHPTDCDKYYICADGKQVLHHCGKNNYFDNSTLTCEPDTSNECWSKTEICTCPGGYNEGDLSAHPTECSKYYICYDGQQELHDCGSNNYFNNDTLSCEPDAYHVCWPNLCMGQPNGALIANPKQCNTFFLCEDNEATAESCFEGQRFDSSSSACVADLQALCYNPCGKENNGPVVLLPHPICNKYYFCNGGKTFVGTCQVGKFDGVTGVCNEAEKCFPNPCDNSSISAFPDPFDPVKFYWCNSEKQPIPATCPLGMEFNLEFKMCKKVSDPDCPTCTKDGSYPTVNGEHDTEFCVCVDGLATKIECPQDYIFNAELGTCYSNAPCDPSFCLDSKEYDTAPNRNDSKSFCMCINKKPLVINCPNNGTFNPYTLECSDYDISPECLQSTCIGETSNNHIFKPINTKTSNGFCQCINQIATFRPCSCGSTFNPDLLICQLEEINCHSYQCRGLPDSTIIPAVATTAGYCECNGDVATYHSCPNDGEFNVTSNKCEAPLCDLTRCTAVENSNNPFAASTPRGFCMCNIGYVPCPSEHTLYSEIFGNCIDPCPEVLCDGKPDKYLTSSLINKHSFCVCHLSPKMPSTYEVCPSRSFEFIETQQRCVADARELCGTDLCKEPGTFQAKDTLSGFCLCTASGKRPTFEECLEGIFIPDKNACLPTAEDVCDISLCCEATIDHPITLPANNSILEFCYCSSPTNAMLLPCPYGKYYNPEKAMCISEEEECSSCPNDIKEGEKVADTTTCDKYLICVDGSMESRTCPKGDYFNVVVNDCVPDVEGICIKKTDCTCLGIYYENELLPHPVNPQMYYTCKGNTLHERKCLTGRTFSATQKQCIANKNTRQKRSVDVGLDREVACVEKEKRSVPSNCSQYEICLQETWQLQTCSDYRYYNAEQRKCLEPRDDFVCSYAKVTHLPSCNSSMEQHLIATKTCRQYYRCKHGKWRLEACNRQEYFNVNISTCLPMPQDHTFNCQDLGNNTTEEMGRTIERVSCQHLSQRYFRKNCAMYLICLDNDWWLQYCPPDMHYNRTLNYCVRDMHEECMDVVRTDTAVHMENVAKQFCEREGLLRPSALACNRYFVCVNGEWQMQYCSFGEFYDATLATCAPDTQSMCINSNTTTKCLPNEKKAIPRNCSAYEQCSNEGNWLKRTCPENETYDELLQQCIINQNICSKHGLKRTCRRYETIPVQQNCSMFYYCSQDVWSLGKCLKGFMYSNEMQMCVTHMPQNECQPLIVNKTQVYTVDIGQKSELCQGKMDGTAIPHPTDCRRFYICIQQSLSHEMKCSRRSYFDPTLAYCRPNDGSCRLPLTGVCANASDESVLAHPSDCQAFYKCSSITGIEMFRCPKAQYFNNITLQCQTDRGECKKEVVSKANCSGLPHGTLLPHETYCNIYYACVRGIAIPVECPDKYQFSSILGKCVQDKGNQCKDGHLVEANLTQSCGDLPDGTYFPDRKDCTRYYICSRGLALPKKCSNSSYFDGQLLLCVPDDGTCPFINNDNQQQIIAPPDPKICEGKHGYLMPDPLNCNNFYACIHNKLKHQTCYAMEFFNTTLRQCQQRSTSRIDINGNSTAIDSKSSPNKVQKLQCPDDPTSIQEMCSEMGEGVSLAVPGDCRRYITCQDTGEEPILQRCRNGETFDSLLGFCRQNDGTCLMENGQHVGECSGKHGLLARDANNCKGYFVCINGQKISQTCEQDEYFSKTLNMCIKDTQQVCKLSQASEFYMMQSCVGLSESVLYPYVHDNCRSYFQCVKGLPKIHKCANGLYFDPVAIKCTQNKTECTLPAQSQQRSPTSSQTFTKLCLGKKLEYPYANVDSECRSFYICHANGHVTHELCPLGMIFNQQLMMCSAEDITYCSKN